MKYFDISDFDSPDAPGSGQKMDLDFLEMLDNAREYSGCAFVVTSGYRTKKANKNAGGVSNSSHLKGYACDIAVLNSQRRWKMIQGLQKAGFNRIGIGSNFIHIDNDPDKVPNVIWTY